MHAVISCVTHLSDDLHLRRSAEDMAAPPQQQLHVLRHVSPRHVQPRGRVRHGEALVHGHCMRDAIPAVQHHTRSPARGVEREYRLRSYVHGGHTEALEEYLCGFVSIGVRVQRSFRQKNGVVLGVGAQVLAGIHVLPQLLHLRPVAHDAPLHGVLKEQSAAVFFCSGAEKSAQQQRK